MGRSDDEATGEGDGHSPHAGDDGATASPGPDAYAHPAEAGHATGAGHPAGIGGTPRTPRSGLRTRLRRLFLAVFLLATFGPVLAVAVLRVVPPFRSALMVQRELRDWTGGPPHETAYTWVGLAEISPHAVVAVVAAEDQKFLHHRGFDRKAIAEALEERERGGRVRGASTLSQQVAKNLFLWPGRNYVRKGLEAGFTVLLETLWPKARIVEVYLNVAEFGDGVYGVEAASQRYFGKNASRLSASEAALLAAVLPSPRRFRVDAPSQYVRGRQSWILRQMGQLGGTAYVEQVRGGRVAATTP